MLCATATAGYICRVNVSTAGPMIMKEFGLSQIAMGKIFSAFILGYALFQIPSGAIAYRFGARKVLSVVTWLWVILTLLQTAVGWGPWQSTANAAFIAFLVWRFFLGISASPTYPGSAQGVSRWVLPRFQGRANGIVISSIGIGSAIAPFLVAKVMVLWGWRMALIISAIPALVIALVWIFVSEPPQVNEIPVKTDENQQERVSNLKSVNFYLLTISYTLQGYVGYIFVSWFYIYLVQERHFGLVTGALMSSLPWILSIFSIPFGGWLSDRFAIGKLGEKWGRRIVPLVGMAMSGILTSAGAHTQNEVMAAICLAFATAFVLCVEGPFWTMMMKISGPKSGTAGGIMNMGSNLGGLISPALTPIIASFLGWETALHIAAFLAVTGSVLWIWIKAD
jgi:MFS transporter, ACS family, glucarate transporter